MDKIHGSLAGGMVGYRRPILSWIYILLGVLALIAVGWIAVFAVVARSVAGIVAAIPMAGIAMGTAVVLFGIAQVVDYIGRTAYNTGQARDDEILEVLTKIEAHLAAAKERREA